MMTEINKTRRWFFEKINKIDEQLSRLIERKREKTQINGIRNEKGEVTADAAEIQRIMGDCYRQLYASGMDNLEEMDRFLEKCGFPILNQEGMENMDRPITSTEIETVIKTFQQTRAWDQMASQANSIKHLERSWHLSFSNSFRVWQREEHLQANSVRSQSPWGQVQTKMSRGGKAAGQCHW